MKIEIRGKRKPLVDGAWLGCGSSRPSGQITKSFNIMGYALEGMPNGETRTATVKLTRLEALAFALHIRDVIEREYADGGVTTECDELRHAYKLETER